MRTTTHRDLENGTTTVRLSGDLTRTTLSTVRTALGKAAAECPTAVLVDLSAMHHANPAHLSTLATASHQARENWGVPMLLYGAEPGIHHDLGAFRSFVALYEDRAQALTAMRAYVPCWMRRHLAPVPGSAAAARALLVDACVAWDLPELREFAKLVASELTANAILHAATDFDVTAAYTRRFLRIAVQDGSTARPRLVTSPPPASGRGLMLVQAFSTHWGMTAVPGGKIVWALLKAGR